MFKSLKLVSWQSPVPDIIDFFLGGIREYVCNNFAEDNVFFIKWVILYSHISFGVNYDPSGPQGLNIIGKCVIYFTTELFPYFQS